MAVTWLVSPHFVHCLYKKRRVVNEKNRAVLMKDLKETNWNTVIRSENVIIMYDTFSEKLANIYNKNCPIVNEKVKTPNRQAVDDKIINKCM